MSRTTSLRFGTKPLLALVAFALLLLPAASASAEVFPTPPPHNDSNNANWQSVSLSNATTKAKCGAEVPNCTFSIGSEWKWKREVTGTEPAFATCIGLFNGRFGAIGAINLTESWMNEPGWNPMCRQQKQQWGSQWGLICKHIPTGEYWVKQRLDYKGELIDLPAGETYGRVTISPSGIMEINFGSHPSTYTRYIREKEGSVETIWSHILKWYFYDPDTQSPAIAPDGGAGSCGWPTF